MRYTTAVVLQMTEFGYEEISRRDVEYAGPVELCKGDGTAKDQLNRENRITDQQLARQNSQQDTVMEAIKKYLTGDVGFSPEGLSAMTSDFLGQNDTSFDSAGEAIRSALLRRGEGGGDMPVGGQFTSNIAGLASAKAGSQSAGLNQIRIQNMLAAIANKFNAANLLSGQAAQSGIGTFNSGAGDALSTYVKAANTGFGNAFTTALGGSLGEGIGRVATGGFSNVLDKVPGMGPKK